MRRRLVCYSNSQSIVRVYKQLTKPVSDIVQKSVTVRLLTDMNALFSQRYTAASNTAVSKTGVKDGIVFLAHQFCRVHRYSMWLPVKTASNKMAPKKLEQPLVFSKDTPFLNNSISYICTWLLCNYKFRYILYSMWSPRQTVKTCSARRFIKVLCPK